MRQKNRELTEVQNENVQLRYDHLRNLDDVAKLEEGLGEIVEEVRTKDDLINQYTRQITQNNVMISKKQKEVDRLNRKFDNLKSAQNGEEYGPFERQIRTLQTRITQSDETSNENQSVWLKKQTELVAFEKVCDDIDSANNNQAAHIAVLSRKRDRVRFNVQKTQHDIDEIAIQTRGFQREMSRLGLQLSNSVENGQSLIETNIHFEAEILERLRSRELESVNLEQQIESLASKREELAEDLMETEKSIMLLETKIQLTKEMKESLDPNYGGTELDSMKREISRMELRLKQIKKQQQNIIQEMSFALERRKTIANRGQVQQRLNKDRTRSDVNKGITELQRKIKRLNEEANSYSAQMQKEVEEQKDLGAEIEQYAHISHEIQVQKGDLENTVKQLEESKKNSQLQLERIQEQTRLFNEKKVLFKSKEAFDTAFQGLNNQVTQFDSLLDSLLQDFPYLSDPVQRLKTKLAMS